MDFQGFEPANTTPVPDVLFDELLPELSGSELKALLYIIRRTHGFKKETDAISLNQFLHGIQTKDGRRLDRGCGISDRTTLVRALTSLEQKGCIVSRRGKTESGDDASTVYGIHFRSQPEPAMEMAESEAPGGSGETRLPSREIIPGGSRETRPPVVGKPDYRWSGNQTTGSRETRLPVVGKSYPQETVIQETESQQTDSQETESQQREKRRAESQAKRSKRLAASPREADASPPAPDVAPTEKKTESEEQPKAKRVARPVAPPKPKRTPATTKPVPTPEQQLTAEPEIVQRIIAEWRAIFKKPIGITPKLLEQARLIAGFEPEPGEIAECRLWLYKTDKKGWYRLERGGAVTFADLVRKFEDFRTAKEAPLDSAGFVLGTPHMSSFDDPNYDMSGEFYPSEAELQRQWAAQRAAMQQQQQEEVSCAV